MKDISKMRNSIREVIKNRSLMCAVEHIIDCLDEQHEAPKLMTVMIDRKGILWMLEMIEEYARDVCQEYRMMGMSEKADKIERTYGTKLGEILKTIDKTHN